MDELALFRRDQARRGLEQTTIASRASALRFFSRWLGRSVLEATPDLIETFLDSRHLSNRARYRWISDLHCFFTWAIDAELATVDPTAKITRPRLRRLLPRPIGDLKLAEAVARATPPMRTMLLCAAYAGFRCCEISRLDRDDILDTHQPQALIAHGKGSKDRLVPMHPDLWSSFRSMGLPGRGAVFLNTLGRRMSEPLVSQRINDYLHGMGIDDTAHSLRHRFATAYYRRSRDLRAVQELLGHESPTSTSIYTAWVVGDAAGVIGQIGL